MFAVRLFRKNVGETASGNRKAREISRYNTWLGVIGCLQHSGSCNARKLTSGGKGQGESDDHSAALFRIPEFMAPPGSWDRVPKRAARAR